MAYTTIFSATGEGSEDVSANSSFTFDINLNQDGGNLDLYTKVTNIDFWWQVKGEMRLFFVADIESNVTLQNSSGQNLYVSSTKSTDSSSWVTLSSSHSLTETDGKNLATSIVNGGTLKAHMYVKRTTSTAGKYMQYIRNPTITVTWDFIAYILNISAPTNGRIWRIAETTGLATDDVSGTQTSFGGGQTIELIAIADDGYEFVSWSDGVTTAQRSVLMDSDKSFSAVFTASASDEPTAVIDVILSPNTVACGEHYSVFVKFDE